MGWVWPGKLLIFSSASLQLFACIYATAKTTKRLCQRTLGIQPSLSSQARDTSMQCLQATHNSFIWLPNGIGAGLGLLQLGLCVIFKQKARWVHPQLQRFTKSWLLRHMEAAHLSCTKFCEKVHEHIKAVDHRPI